MGAFSSLNLYIYLSTIILYALNICVATELLLFKFYVFYKKLSYLYWLL